MSIFMFAFQHSQIDYGSGKIVVLEEWNSLL